MAESGSSLSSRFARLKPFSGPRRRTDDEDQGDVMGPASIAGGGHAARPTAITKDQLRVSPALKAFLAHQGTLSHEDVNMDGDQPTAALQALLTRPHINVPAHLTDRSHLLSEYFISSSHNTYLMAHQLYGSSSASAYETVLNAGSRCVEIDVWDNDANIDEPRVTHGYTLVSDIPFRSVCETIRDVAEKEAFSSINEPKYGAAPIILSLENHCDAYGQLRLVRIMNEVWGDRLLSEAVIRKGHQEQEGSNSDVSLDELGSKIVVIIEYYIPNEIEENGDDSSNASDDEREEKQGWQAYKDKKKAAPQAIIVPELAAMGVYAQSVKPRDNSWFEEVGLKNGPHHHLINVSEVQLGAHLPGDSHKIARHNAKHLMRIYPKGTRISSKNLNPVPFWGIGAQICALNWQTFGASMQLNEALFSGSDGFVLKPTALRAGGDGKLSTGRMKRLRLHVAGASDVPVPDGRQADDIKPYVTCSLIHPDDLHDNPPKRKTDHYKQHKLEFLHKGQNSPVTDPIWDETLEWEYEDNEMVFLRMLIKSDDKFASNPKLAVAAVRVMYAVTGWSFIRMLDLRGRETRCSLLVNFEVEDI
jgi:phosphatidylinositol phospholipase C delta